MTLKRPASAAEWVTGALRQEILTGQLPQRSVVRQEEIAARFGVSRMPVREAIRRLSAEGWIVERPNRMALIASLDPDDARELYMIRAELESLALRQSIPHLSAERMAEIDRTYEALGTTQPDRYSACHLAFHLALYAGAGARLRSLIENHIMLSERYLQFERTNLITSDEDALEHRELREAIASGDIGRAEAALREHILGAGTRITRAILHAKERNDGA